MIMSFGRLMSGLLVARTSFMSTAGQILSVIVFKRSEGLLATVAERRMV